MQKGFVHPVYKAEYLETKLKFYDDKIITEGSKVSKDGSQWDCQYICRSQTVIDSILRMGNKYYPQVLLEECKRIQSKRKNDPILY